MSSAIHDDPCAGGVPALDPVSAAKEAGLCYVNDSGPGIRRVRCGRGFRYLDASGRRVTDASILQRIRALAIPPAWSDVWIAPSSNGHIQATGRDARGRKQYRYHARWRAVRDEAKYDRLVAFGSSLPAIRARVARDLARPGVRRATVLATIVRLLETTLIRVGNEEYARHNNSFGLTTLRNRHVEVQGATLHFRFRGKSGIEHRLAVHDRRLARIVRRCQELPGQELFLYEDEDGSFRPIRSDDVNDYLREISGQPFTAKDFRTWSGTVLAAYALLQCKPAVSQAAAKRRVAASIAQVASRLGNTRTVCQRCYVHPAVIAAYVDGTLAEMLRLPKDCEELHRSPEEAAVLAFLQRRMDERMEAA
jgi:DNA topoisomerase-1